MVWILLASQLLHVMAHGYLYARHRNSHADTRELLRGNLPTHLTYVIGIAARSATKDYLQERDT